MKTFKEQKITNCGWALDSLVTLDFHSRGIIKPIYEHMVKKVGEPLTTHAAAKLFKALKEPKQTVLIGTGFLIKPTLNPETDGPISAVLLARAISRLGGMPVLVAEENCLKVLRACCASAELILCDTVDIARKTPHSVVIEIMPPASDKGATKAALDKLLSMRPAAMVSIEHPGKGADGKYYSLLGYELENWPGAIDDLLELVGKQGGLSIGIGDGGNEAGMGYAKPEIDSITPYGKLINACSSCQAPIVASVSEFGAYGLIAALQLISGEKVLPSPQLLEIVLRAAIVAGSVDGCSGIPRAAIDMIGVRYIKSFIDLLEGVLVCTEEFCPTRPFFIDFCRGADIGAPGNYSGGHG